MKYLPWKKVENAEEWKALHEGLAASLRVDLGAKFSTVLVDRWHRADLQFPFLWHFDLSSPPGSGDEVRLQYFFVFPEEAAVLSGAEEPKALDWAGLVKGTHRRVETTRLMRYFSFDHLPPSLQRISKPCGELAAAMIRATFTSAYCDQDEVLVGLRKLLEAKDAFVRAILPD